jgi:hypothetical protein
MNLIGKKISVIISFLILSLIFVGSINTETKTNLFYTPKVGDTFGFAGTIYDNEVGIDRRIVTNMTTGDLIEYVDMLIEKNDVVDLQNISFHIENISPTIFTPNLSINSVSHSTNSFEKNTTKYLPHDSQNWQNTTNTNNFTPSTYNQSMMVDYNYTNDKTPSTMLVGDSGMIVYVGIPEVPLGGVEGPDQGGQCSDQEMLNLKIADSGRINTPFITNISQLQIRGIFNITLFDRTVFDQDNLAWLGSHSADNITWSQVEIGNITGIDPAYDGTQVVVVFQLEKNFGTGMLEALEKTCPSNGGNGGGSPFANFGDFSKVQLTWNETNLENRPFTINSFQFGLSTKTYTGINHTERFLKKNMSLGDPQSPFYAYVNLSLLIDVTILFEYDINTGILLRFKTIMKITIGTTGDNIEAPLGDSGYTGYISLKNIRKKTNLMEFNLNHHTSLYQEDPPTTIPTTTTTTKDISQSSSKTNIPTITTNFPFFLSILPLTILIVMRKQNRS